MKLMPARQQVVACAPPTRRNESRRRPMQTTTACCRQRRVLRHVLQLRQQAVDVRQGRQRYMRAAVWQRTSRRVTVISAMHRTATVNRVVRRVCHAAVVNQRTVTRPDVVHRRRRQQVLKQMDRLHVGVISLTSSVVLATSLSDLVLLQFLQLQLTAVHQKDVHNHGTPLYQVLRTC